MTSRDMTNAISSPALEDGATRSDSPDGPMTDLFGQPVAPVHRSVSPESRRNALSAKARVLSGALEELASQYALTANTLGLPMPATYGRKFGDSQLNLDLDAYSESRLTQWEHSRGSPLYQHHLKYSATPLGAEGLPASSVGAPHIRQRLWWVADAKRNQRKTRRPPDQFRECSAPEGVGAHAESGRRSAVGGVADAEGQRQQSGPKDDGFDIERMESERGKQVKPAACGEDDRLDDTPSARCEPKGRGKPEEPQGRGRVPGVGCEDGGLGNTDESGSQGRRERSDEYADQQSPWAAGEFIACDDDKARPVEPGIFPLADGLPEALDGGGTIPRIGVIRGAGNAIVPKCAAEFIRTRPDVRGCEMTVRIMIGDALSQLAELPDESVHCVMTSPPYWGLRAYKGDDGMIGLEPTFDAHLENLVAVFREVRRVLRSDGTLWLNYGDAYASGTKGSGGDTDWQSGGRSAGGTGGSRERSFMDEPFKLNHGLKPKDLMMMPARVAWALQTDGVPDPAALRAIQRATEILIDEYDGSPPARVMNALDRLDAEYAEAKGRSWWLRSEICWHKSNPMPESCRDRPTSAHEKLFLLSKSAKYFYDADAVRTPSTGVPKMPDNWDTGPGAHGAVHRTGREKGKQRAMTKDEQQSGGANLRNVWKIATHSFSEAHFATFPPALVEPCIKAGTSTHGVCEKCAAPWVRDGERILATSRRTERMNLDRNDAGTGDFRGAGFQTTSWAPSCQCKVRPTVPATVLDPFGGAGTVGLVAERLGRDSIIIEISPDYAAMAKRRILDDAPLLANVALE